METLARRPYKAAYSSIRGEMTFPHNPTKLDVGFYSPEAWTNLKSPVSLPYSSSSEFNQELPLKLLGPDPPISQPTTAWVAPLRICPGLTPWHYDFPWIYQDNHYKLPSAQLITKWRHTNQVA
jgi:hypothetical protein